MLKIGYNPDFIIRMKADYVVTGYPLEILSIIQGHPNRSIVPTSKIGLLAQWIGLALATTAIAASFVYVNRKRKP